MMRTVEVLFVIVILLSSFALANHFAVLPSAREAFGTELGDLAQSTLETLNAKGVLSEIIFKSYDDPAWADLQKALSASLPPNVVYNLSIYDLSSDGDSVTYDAFKTISDTNVMASKSTSASFLVASPNVTFTEEPQKIGESTGKNLTLYILNCTDANGWWITGYTGQSLAKEFNNLLSPYFATTVIVNSTSQFELILQNTSITHLEESVQDAVIINTFGEAVPIPSSYAGNYRGFCEILGQKVNTYNFTWVNIVGYPFYYVSNLDSFDDEQSWGIYGIEKDGVQTAGLTNFLKGLTGKSVSGTDIMKSVGVVDLSSISIERSNYYGLYPNPYQTASRALYNNTLVGSCELVATELFSRSQDYPNYIPAAVYRNIDGGAFTSIGLTRTPDARVAALALLMYYNPSIYKSEFGASGTSRLVTLQLSQHGGA
ncbi:MAG: hypothetical protein NUK63_09500 [Candidatus Bathyarchaeum tardum]|nr:MAG: hypothetical protein NUK63_09500 [Candidatus Bathyarchaeum tardum]